MQLEHLDDERRANGRLGVVFPSTPGSAGKGREMLGDMSQIVNISRV